MKERIEKAIELGFLKKTEGVIEEIERTAKKMQEEGWGFLNSRTDLDLNLIILIFEREINN